MARRVSVSRIIASVIAAGLIAATVYSVITWRQLDREFFEWIDARPVSISVDLSQSGRLTAPFRQTCSISHSEAFYLALPSSDAATRDQELLDGLKGTITITDSDGNEIICEQMHAGLDTRADAAEPILLTYFHPFENGDYIVTIDVASGAPALAGMEQTIFAKYQLCGLERFPSAIAGFFAFASGIPAGIMLLVLVPKLVKHGIWKPDKAT